MKDLEKTQATLRLMNELAKGQKSGEEKGWLRDCEKKSVNLINC